MAKIARSVIHKKQDPGSALHRGSSLQMNKKLGQHILRNPGILVKMLEAAQLGPHETVLEIGPGTGNLTVQLLKQANSVAAIEMDARLASELKRRVSTEGLSHKLKLTMGDCLKVPFPRFDACVTNLPYAVSSPFIFKLLAHKPTFRVAVVMLQREFAERLVAKVGEEFYGRLALNVSLYCAVNRVCKVDRKSFNPPPEVDSMVVRLVPHSEPIDVCFEEFDGLLRLCFNRRNKTVRANLMTKPVLALIDVNRKSSSGMDVDSKSILQDVLSTSGIGNERACSVDLNGYLRLLLEFNKAGIHFASTSQVSNDGDASSSDDDESDSMSDS